MSAAKRSQMKVFLAFVLVLLTAAGRPPADIGNEIASCIRSGNARALSAYFGNSVDLTVLGKEEMYSKAQAEQVLRNFFLKYPPRSFTLKHHQPSPAASQYGIGSYVSRNNHTFRIYFLVRKIGNQSFIQQLSIEPQKVSH